MDISTFLNNNSGALTLLFSGVVAISTVVYAWLTHNLVSETKKMRKYQVEPEINITMEPKEGYLQYIYLIIQNIGGGAAIDVEFTLTPDFELYNSRKLSEVGIIQKGLKILAPNQKLELLLTDIPYLIEKDKFDIFNIKVTYSDSTNEKKEHEFVMDLSQFRNIQFKPEHYLIPNIESIKKELCEIKEKL